MPTKRFRIKSEQPPVVYEFAGPNDVTLRDLLLVEQETEGAVTAAEIGRLGERFMELSQEEAKRDPEAIHLLAATIWMARVHKLREAGDLTTRVSFYDSCDFMLGDFEPIKDPDDHAPKAPKKGAKKRATPTVSRPVVEPASDAPA